MAEPLIGNAKWVFKKIEKMLYTAPAFVGAVKAVVPEEVYQVILTNEQKERIASGALKLMTKKDGSLMANLIDPKQKRLYLQCLLARSSCPRNCHKLLAIMRHRCNGTDR